MRFRIATMFAMALVTSACNDSTPAPEPARLTTLVIASPGLVSDGDVKTLVTIASDQYGTIMPNATITWSSTNPAVATISTAGVLSALQEGQTEVVATARAGDVSVEQRLPLTVSLHPAVALELNRDAIELPVGTNAATAVAVRGTDGRVLQNRVVTYTSDNPAVAEVSAAGVVRALAGGSARIIAAYGSLRDTLVVTVPTPVPSSASYRVSGVDGGATMPAIVDDETELGADGQLHRYITRIDSGTVSTGVGYTVALYMSFSERSELQGNVIERVLSRTTIRDEGTVSYNAPTNDALLASTKTGGLQHQLFLGRTPVELAFREPGSITTWTLRLTRTP
jgi:hypothetical protein